jgi:UDP-glucuronate 4-epimerase
MLRGEEIPMFGDGSTERDYTFVADAVDGIIRALDWCVGAAPGAFEIINIGEHATTSLARLVELIATELELEPRIRPMPAQPGDVQRTHADISHAREVLGYDPRTTMEEGIHQFAQWLREQPES